MATHHDSQTPFHESTSDRRYNLESVRIRRSGGTDKVWAVEIGGGQSSCLRNSTVPSPDFDHASSPDFDFSLTSLEDLRILLLLLLLFPVMSCPSYTS